MVAPVILVAELIQTVPPLSVIVLLYVPAVVIQITVPGVAVALVKLLLIVVVQPVHCACESRLIVSDTASIETAYRYLRRVAGIALAYCLADKVIILSRGFSFLYDTIPYLFHMQYKWDTRE
jgi:hypothetical protein